MFIAMFTRTQHHYLLSHVFVSQIQPLVITYYVDIQFSWKGSILYSCIRFMWLQKIFCMWPCVHLVFVNLKCSLKVLNFLLLYSIQVTPEDVLPVAMCTSCIYKLEMCHQFVHGCLDADIKLRTILGLEVDDMEVSLASHSNLFSYLFVYCLSVAHSVQLWMANWEGYEK